MDFWTTYSIQRTLTLPTTFLYLAQAFVIASLIYYFLIRRNRRKTRNELPHLSEEKKEEILARWQPEPLVPDFPEDLPIIESRKIDGKMGKIVVSIDGKEFFNMATSNFLGFVGDERIEAVAKKTIFKYGVGSCGPRNFYGTVDVHLELERQLAEYMGCEEAILYSDGFATIASAIPAYAKRGDIVFADKGVNFAVQKGLQASRSQIKWFEHNDVEDLERLLREQSELDKKNPKSSLVRRFIIVEGLYAKSADLCPLKELIELKWKYKVRIFIDESLSFGLIGKTGKGVTEHFGVDVIDVDMVMVSLENAIASTGGFCCGRSFLIGHQRLSGLGYCFSASLPPLLATAANEALKIMAEDPDRFQRLQSNAKALHNGLVDACFGTSFGVVGNELSPVQHVVFHTNNKADEKEKLDSLVDELYKVGVLVTRARYLDSDEAFPAQQSVKINCSSEMTVEEVQNVVEKTRIALEFISNV